MYFSADDGVNGAELWKTDGSIAGTVFMKDINESLGEGSWSAEFCVVNDLLYLIAEDAVHGLELWKTDGTPAVFMFFKENFLGSAPV